LLCLKCANKEQCVSGNDCVSGNCNESVCVEPVVAETCFDEIKNQDETDVDCGGTCSGCVESFSCLVDSDCLSLNCVSGVCQPVTQTCFELGGIICSSNETCTGSIQSSRNGDCCVGGVCEQVVVTCTVLGGVVCDVNETCIGTVEPTADGLCCIGQCETSETCTDGIHNQNEIGIDCGGVCFLGAMENICSDGLDNDKDCASDCADSDCVDGSVCVSGFCSGGVCQACTDNDNDSYFVEGGICGLVDCNDANQNMNPGLVETCDEIDNDCDGTIDEDCEIVLFPPWDWPHSDNQLDYGGGLDIYLSITQSYFNRYSNLLVVPTNQMLAVLPENLNANETLVMDYNPDFFTNYDAKQQYERFLNFYLEQNPQTVVGTYISGRDCFFNEDDKFHPNNTVNCASLPSEALLFSPYNNEDRWAIDVANVQYRQLFGDLIVNMAIERERPFIYLDNIVHPGTGGWGATGVTWEDVTDHLAYIKPQLNALGIKAAVNVAGSPWGFAENNFEDADLLGNAVDGMSFELPFNWKWARPHLNRVQDGISVYRRWLDSGKIVLFVPVVQGGIETRQGEKRVVAAIVMMFREPGDAIFVDRWYWRQAEEFEWKDWPSQFGPPLRDANFTQVDQDWKADRSFANGNLGIWHFTTVSTQTSSTPVTLTLPSGSEQYVLINQSANGILDLSNYPQVTYTPNLGAGDMVDSAMFGRNFSGDFYSDVIVLSFTING